ncbi:TolC family protein [Mucilaginibacter sp. HMF5004]|uniref:TolC family protein n=1 Tax=Mucilaginibacter rivuli TaxID=2857527 RepID=UPI001C5D7654|nr:TolC family protein [Mucilaginibacter rivuli]MBW4890922.1 TolC family protein [Mucilaginibacter rivuli]
MKKVFAVKVYFTLFFILFTITSYGQESILDAVSYPYLEKLIATAKTNYPAVKIKQVQVTIADNSYKLAKETWWDAFSFSYVYSPQNTFALAAGGGFTSFFTGYQISVSYNLGNLLGKRFTIRNAKENLVIAQLEQDSYNLNIELEVKKRYFTYLQQLAILRLRTKSGHDAESIYNQSKHQFENGNETIENYTKASLSYSESNQARLDAETAFLIAKSTLEEILGKKLEDIK